MQISINRSLANELHFRKRRRDAVFPTGNRRLTHPSEYSEFGLCDLEDVLPDVTKRVHAEHNIRIRIRLESEKYALYEFPFIRVRIYAWHMEMSAKLNELVPVMNWKDQGEIAAFFGVAQPTVSKWINGKQQPAGDKRDAINALYDEKIGRPDSSGVPPEISLNQRFNRLPQAKKINVLSIFESALKLAEFQD